MNYNLLPTFTLMACTSLLVGCGSSSSSSETSDETIPQSPTNSVLRVNEIVASASDDGHDWIELYAPIASVNLSDYTLVDDNADHTPQALPDVTLAAGEYLVIQAIDEDDTPPASGYYVTFKLGADDAVTLLKEGEQVDQLDWNDGDALTGFSYGLYTDGSDNAQMLSPTPGSANKTTDEAPVVDSGSGDGEENEVALTDQITVENTVLRINEMVASDAEGGYDWVELYVTGDSAVNLSDYFLADEKSIASALPDVTLYAGDYYRVYATGDEVTELDSVNFKLGSSDEVRLYLGDDLVDVLSWKKDQALAGYSYGRFPDGSDATTVLSPSAMEKNVIASHGPLVINEVVANDTASGFDWFELLNTSNENITLADYQVLNDSSDIEAAQLPDVTLSPGEYIVVFAIGSEDGSEDNVIAINDHFVPFSLGSTDELSLILAGNTVDYIEWQESDVLDGFSYGLTADISTDLKATISGVNPWDKDILTPTPGTTNQAATAFNPEVVSNLYVTISTANWQDILANPLDEEYHEASVSLNNVALDSVAIRTKGGSSLSSVANSSSDRYSFKIDINEYVDGQKFFGLKKFTLQNSFNDPSYMRETIAYNLLAAMDVPTPQHAYVNVYINDELFGLYLMVEAIDGEFIENNFDNANGDLYKPDGIGSDLTWINADITSYSDINLKTNEDTSDQGAFINFVEKMDAGATDVINVDSLLRYMSVSVALSNLDSYHGALAHNYYLYEQDGVFSLLPWDFNEAFGTFNMGCRSDIRELYIDEPTNGPLADKPMIANVFANQDYVDTYHTYLMQLIDGPLSSATFAAEVARIANIIREHVENDPSSFYGAALFEQNLHSTVSRFYGLTEFMEYRVNNMTQQLQGSATSTGNGAGFCGATSGPGRF